MGWDRSLTLTLTLTLTQVALSVETNEDVADELSDLERILATSPGAEPQQQT